MEPDFLSHQRTGMNEYVSDIASTNCSQNVCVIDGVEVHIESCVRITQFLAAKKRLKCCSADVKKTLRYCDYNVRIIRKVKITSKLAEDDIF